jgi:hypothetical protein
LVAAKKPLIGHNLFFDLLFMLRWLDGPLSQSFTELKERLSGMFPYIYDTKYLGASGIMGESHTSMSTTLSDVYKRFIGDIVSTSASASAAEGAEGAEGVTPDTNAVVACNITTAPGFPEFLNPLSEDAKQFHNAGYDAFCTGCVFARQASTLDGMAAPAGDMELAPAQGGGWREEANNMLFMMRSLYHMTLTPGDVDGVMKVKGTLFNVSGFAKFTKTDDLLTVFSKAFGSETPAGIDVIWADDNSVYVAVSDAIMTSFCSASGITGIATDEAVAAMHASIAEQLGPVCEREQASATAAAAALAAAVGEGAETPEALTLSPWRVVLFSTYLAEKLERLGAKDGEEAGGATPSSKRQRVA